MVIKTIRFNNKAASENLSQRNYCWDVRIAVSQICNEIVSFGGAMGISSRIDLVLNLPPNQGSSREFENREIRNIRRSPEGKPRPANP